MTYHYQTQSTDVYTNTGTGTDKTFTTTGCTGSAAVNTESSSGQIATDTGGTATLTNSGETVTLTIPAGYSETASYFQIKQLDKTSVLSAASVPAGYLTIGNMVYDFKALGGVSTSISNFSQEITILMTYTDSNASGMDESSFLIYRWDGSLWNRLSGCSVDISAKTVTCATTSFSTFALFGQQLSSGSSSQSLTTSSASAPVCTDESPVSAPDLFKITTGKSDADLYFTPIPNNTKYYISFSSDKLAEEHGVEVELGDEGVQNHKVNLLSAGTTYYFKVRGQNGCMPGPWSQILAASTTSGSFSVVEKIEESISSLIEDKMEITDLTVGKAQPDRCSWEVINGDNLWNISKDVYGAGKFYQKIIDENIGKYSEITSILRVGWELSFPCEIGEKKISEEVKTHDVLITIKNQGESLVNADIELYSEPKYSVTDENGEAFFEDVSEGEHVIKISYKTYSTEQNLVLEGEEKEIDLSINVTLKDSLLPTWVWLTIVSFLVAVMVTLFLLRRKSG